jgi:hypothetical protein
MATPCRARENSVAVQIAETFFVMNVSLAAPAQDVENIVVVKTGLQERRQPCN